MRIIVAKFSTQILLGKQGENLATQVQIPVVQEWRNLYGEGTFQLVNKRPDDEHCYACIIGQDEEKVIWNITNTETAQVGFGEFELQYYAGDTLAKSYTWKTIIIESVCDRGDTPPEPWQSWVEEVLQSGIEAKESAEEAIDAAEDAEAHAVGKRSGVDVPSTDPTYHNNAKYYAEQAETTIQQAVKYVEQTLTDSQKEQARENINAAATDGFYHGMGVGNAEQLISTVGVTDKVPYNFRTSGGSADIGNRLNDKIVGGTITWNQKFNVLTNDATVSGVTFTHLDDGTIIINGTASTSFFNFIFNDCNMMGLKTNGNRALLSVDVVKNTDNIEFGCHALNGRVTWGGAKHTASFARIGTINSSLAEGFGCTCDTGTVFNDFRIKITVFDLTQMFGSTIADYIYSLEQTTTGAGVAWFKKLFPKPYYEYNTGELMSVCTNGHITRGFNAWDEKWELGGIYSNSGQPYNTSGRIRSKNFIKVEPNTNYFFRSSSTHSRYFYVVATYDINKNFISDIGYQNNFIAKTPVNAYFIKICLLDTTYHNDVCINLSWSGYRNGEYESYVEHNYPLSAIELRGISRLDASNNLYYDGDTYEKDGTVTRKYGIVDLGTLQWLMTTSSGRNIFTSYPITNIKPSYVGSVIPKFICPLYRTVSVDVSWINLDISYHASTGSDRVSIVNNQYSSDAEFKSAMSGVYLVYELATPTTETANPFIDPQIVDDFGTEEYVDALATAETNPRDVAIPVGHETFYQANLRDKLQNLPANASADGLYLVKQTGNKQELITYTPESELLTWNKVQNKPFETIGENLTVVGGALTVVTTDIAEPDNTKPITSAGTHVILGNINSLLETI